MTTAEDEEQQHMQIDSDDNDALSSGLSDSENDVSNNEEPAATIEWLATGREKRSTAGNRMKSMIAAEEPDDELELLFAEDADDAGFTDAGDDASDAQMSSSEDEDAQENADELEGEKELEKQARDSKQAARKRKAQEAIPIKFRKKVKIDTSKSSSASATPAAPKPRPKKKSERLSWLPTPADMPTRASKRETTMAGKEQLHKQMAEREFKRLKQIEAMERKAKKMEALKKPPLTQAERLAEAALVEKRNAKSLNRWEEAEKQREEARKAKLAALNNRTLEGPVVTFWSGMAEWVDGKLKHVGKIITIEDKPAKKKRHSVAGHVETAESPREAKTGQADSNTSPAKTAAVGPCSPSPKQIKSNSGRDKNSLSKFESSAGVESKSPTTSWGLEQATQSTSSKIVEMTSTSYPLPPNTHAPQAGDAFGQQRKSISENDLQPPMVPVADIRPPDLKPPDLRPPGTGLYTNSIFALPTQPSLMKPPELKPNSFLAPPVGISHNGLSMPMIGYHSSPNSMKSSNVLAPPNPAQRQPLLSMPQTNNQLPFPPASIPARPAEATASTPLSEPVNQSPKTAISTQKSAKANTQKNQPKEVAPPPPPSAPANGRATRNCIILQSFNENAVKDKSVQTRIILGREMKQGPAARCVITNHPAKYRDPKTGLPYYNAHAFKEIQKLYRGEYKWSSLVGAWMGYGAEAASGVPARFLDPNAPGPLKEQIPSDAHTHNDETVENAGNTVESYEHAAEISVLSALQPNQIAASAAEGQSNSSNSAPLTTSRSDTGPGKSDTSAIADESSSITPIHNPTTQAIFALNTDMDM
ncbi:YL1-domain-containing protein [Xylaria nigripes]|nr:YL1-domain-containing protein [Xylaria nigripes]